MNVSVSGPQTFTVSLKKPDENNFKIATISGGVQVPASFGDLDDFNEQNVRDKSVIMYDAATQKYTTVNVDELLSAAVTDTSSPGLPSVFIDQLDTDLDDRIDLDAGTF